MPEPIISVSGLRGILGESLTPPVAIRYATAFAATLPPGAVVVSRDSRPSGELLADAVHAGLRAVGRDTIDAGIAGTPTVGVLVRHLQAAGAIQITASHNPPPYNGLKLFSSEGRIIPNAPGQEVLERYRSAAADWAAHDRLGSKITCEDPHAQHLKAVLATVDVERIRRRKIKVLLDCNHGAGGPLGRRLLEALGCELIVLGGEPDGQFAHPAEPTAENLAGVLSKVTEVGADVGFCQDPDADRLAVIDEEGHYLGEEYTLAICVDHVLAGRKGPIVANCSTSRMSEDLADQYGVPYFRSAVGEANVADVMLARQAVFGGEGNGGPIDPRVGLVRDSFAGMALLLDAMALREACVGQLAAALPSYAIVKTKMAAPGACIGATFDALTARFPDAKPDRLDGLRLDWPDRWLLVRASNTEPIIRAIAEAGTETEARHLCDQAAEVLLKVGRT
jgi:phosphomannomutase